MTPTTRTRRRSGGRSGSPTGWPAGAGARSRSWWGRCWSWARRVRDCMRRRRARSSGSSRRSLRRSGSSCRRLKRTVRRSAPGLSRRRTRTCSGPGSRLRSGATRWCCSRRRAGSRWSAYCRISPECGGTDVLYHLLAPLAKQHILFNLFTYITFRAAGATVTALLFAFVFGPRIIHALHARKVGQVVRAEGPASHHGKRGTPTMGGLIIILGTVVPTLLWARLDTRYVLVAVVAMLWMGVIGFVDDYLKIVRGKSQGLVARWKLAGQISFGVALGLFLVLAP